MSDPIELSAPRDPGSYRRARPAGWAVWAVIVFGLACVAGGYLVARFGPELYPSKPRAGVMDTPAPSFAPLAAPLAPSTRQEGGEPSLSAEPATGEMTSRMDALEADRSRVAAAAASALTAAALVEASQTSRPFAGELQALATSAPSLDLRSLAADAERGAPSRMALAVSFPDYAARAASAARAPGDGAGVLDRIGYALSRVVTLRRVGDVPGQGLDAVLAKAEQQVEDGDLTTALATLEALPPAGKDALGPWRDRAERRARIDRNIAEVRAQALKDLTDLARSGG